MKQRQTKHFLWTRNIIILGSVAVVCLAMAIVGLIFAFANRPMRAAVAGAEHLEFIDNADQSGYEIRGFNTTGFALTNVALTIPATYNSKPVTGIYGDFSDASGAFYSCYNLVSVSFESPSNVTSIGNYAFYCCINLTSITIPASVTSIGKEAFLLCTELTSITIPANVTSIGDGAFYGCPGLTSVTIPASVTSIGINPFSKCINLTSITVDSGNTAYRSETNNCIIRNSDNVLIVGCQETNIPGTVTSIGNGAFYGCSGLTEIIIPASVTNVGMNPFSGCNNLISIIVDEENEVYRSESGNCIIQNSDDTLIVGCQTTVIPESVTGIGEDAFRNLIGLISVTISASVTNIIGNPFNGCSGLTSIIVDSLNPAYRSDSDNCIIRNSDDTLIVGCQKTTIPISVVRIGYQAFLGCTSLAEIPIPTSVTSIGSYAFTGCTGLTEITIPASVVSIGNMAFSGTRLAEITIPASVTSIGLNPFSNCSALTSIKVDELSTAFRSEDSNCIIQNSDNVLISGCKNTIIPISVTIIDSYAFYYCFGLTAITIPANVTSIGDFAFLSCADLKSIKVERFTLPSTIATVGMVTFSGANLTRIIVPYADGAAKAAYSLAANWSAYADIIEEMPPVYDGIVRLRSSGGVQLAGDIKKVWYYDLETSSTLQLPTQTEMNSAFTGSGKQYDGYTFEGWYDNKECDGAVITEIPGGVSGTLYYFAKWVRAV